MADARPEFLCLSCMLYHEPPACDHDPGFDVHVLPSATGIPLDRQRWAARWQAEQMLAV
jgi:hypothetical protein